MVVARNQTITNAPVSRISPFLLDTVAIVANYDFTDKNFSDISNSGQFSQGSTTNKGKILWNSLDSSISQVTYNFDREYSFSQDSSKSNRVYFSGVVTQPFSSDVTAGGDVTAKYVDTDGNTISKDVVLSGNVGDNYTTNQLPITGYTFKEVKGNPNGKFTATAQTVTYVYTKDPVAGGDVTAKYVDTDGNTISKDVVKSGNVGDDYSTDQLTISGYTFKEVQGNPSGQFTDVAQTVTYIYTKDAVTGGDVTAKYVDIDGNKIAKDVVKSGNIDEDYTTNQLAITGYTFKEVKGDPSGQFTATAQTVTYVYTKNEDVVVPPASTPDNNESTNKSTSHASTPSKKYDSKKALPETGEKEGIVPAIIGGTILVLLIGLVLFRKTKKFE